MSCKPQAICFNSKEALERMAGFSLKRKPWLGNFAAEYLVFDWSPIIWALNDSSPRNKGERHKKRVEYLKLLLAVHIISK